MDAGGQGSLIIVVDTNVLIESLLVPNGHIVTMAKGNTLIAPDFLLLEMGNILRKYHHFSNLDANDVIEYLASTRDVIRHWLPDRVLLNRAIKLSMAFNHAIYDCLFLALTELYEVPLWTLDKKLKEKAKALGLRTI